MTLNPQFVMDKKEFSDSTFQRLKTNAAEIMNNLRDTIWALNRDRIQLTGISDRFKNYVHKLSATYPAIKVEIDENIRENISLSAVQALNIFRILQEAFINALKHSHCDYIRICIACDDAMNISVLDNGSGMDESTIKGNGIRNMQARAKESGFNFSINNMSPGTEVLLVPVNPEK